MIKKSIAYKGLAAVLIACATLAYQLPAISQGLKVAGYSMPPALLPLLEHITLTRFCTLLPVATSAYLLFKSATEDNYNAELIDSSDQSRGL